MQAEQTVCYDTLYTDLNFQKCGPWLGITKAAITLCDYDKPQQ